MFELDCVNTFSDNGRKPLFSVILWPLEGQTLADMAQKRINNRLSQMQVPLATRREPAGVQNRPQVCYVFLNIKRNIF